MVLLMDDEPREFPAEKVNQILHPDELSFIDETFDLLGELMEAKKVIRKLETACDKALTLRGLWTAINDPPALEAEKRDLRERYLKIELEMRAAIITATGFWRKQK